MIYNSIIRRFPAEECERQKQNAFLYKVIIHMLASAVQKLSREVNIRGSMRLYRGISSAMAQDFLGRDGRSECSPRARASAPPRRARGW